MARKINDDCVSCGNCGEICPVNAIIEGDSHFEIDPEICIDCGACEEGCPVDAIVAE